MKFSKLFLVSIALMTATISTSYAQSNSAETQVADTTQTIKVKVTGVGCSNDLKSISANVEKLDGVTSCDVGKAGATTTFVVSFNPALTKEEDIHAAIQNTGGCHNPEEKPYRVKL